MPYRVAFAVLLAAVLASAVASHAEDTDRWESDLALAREGVPSDQAFVMVRDVYVTRFEDALAHAKESLQAAASRGDLANPLFRNPYPVIGLALANYYDKTGKPDDALRVLDVALDGMTNWHGPATDRVFAMLRGEHGAIRIERRDWPGALADFNDALDRAGGLKPMDHAWLMRGRAYALIKLDRLDEASNAVTTALIYQPQNKLALAEYARIRALQQGQPSPALPLSIGLTEPTIETFVPGDGKPMPMIVTNAVSAPIAIQSVSPPNIPLPPSTTPAKAVGRTHDCRAFYPAESIRLWESGEVAIRYDVGADGVIGNVAVVKSSGSDRLDQAALVCVRTQWKSTPATQGDKPVVSPGHIATIRFASPDPQTAGDYLDRGKARAAVGDRKGAVSDYSVAIALSPDLAEAYRARAAAYDTDGHADLAAADRATLRKLRRSKT